MSFLVQAFLPSEPPAAQAARAYLLDGVFFDQQPKIEIREREGRLVEMLLKWRADRAPMVLRRLTGDDADAAKEEAAEEAELLGLAGAAGEIRSCASVVEWEIERGELEADDDAWGAFKAWEAWVLREAGGWLYSPGDGLFDAELRLRQRAAPGGQGRRPAPETIVAAELQLPLEDTPFGPKLALPARDRDFEPLIWVVNGAVEGDLPGLVEKVTRGETCSDGAVTARVEADGICSLSVKWRAKPWKVRRQVLVDLVTQLERLRAASPKPPAPWLFRPDAIGADPHPDEQEMLSGSEQRAEQLDRLSSTPGADAAEVHAKRRLLLAELDAFGVTTARFGHHRLRRLEEWGLPALASYQRAAIALAKYSNSAERSHRLGATPPRVSLDWFRAAVPAPEGWPAGDFLAFCERSLHDAHGVSGQQGQLFVHQNGRRVTIDWRCDDAVHPGVLRATAR